jgi:hypothetical protein
MGTAITGATGNRITKPNTRPSSRPPPAASVRQTATIAGGSGRRNQVAGSSPVAPAKNILQIAIFCCHSWRRRPPASRRLPGLIAHGRSAASCTPKVLQTGIFCRRLGATRATGPPSSRADPARRIRRTSSGSPFPDTATPARTAESTAPETIPATVLATAAVARTAAVDLLTAIRLSGGTRSSRCAG